MVRGFASMYVQYAMEVVTINGVLLNRNLRGLRRKNFIYMVKDEAVASW